MDLAPWTAPPGHRIDRYRRRLSMRRPRPLSTTPPTGEQARDLLIDAYSDHPGHAATVAKILAAFAEAEAGNPQRQCDLFDDFVGVDCHLASLFEKREEAVAGKPSTVQSGEPGNPEADLAAHVMRVVFAGLAMNTLYKHLLGSANRYGWGAAEIDWGVRVIDGRAWIVPVWFTLVRSRRFRIATPNGVDVTGIGDLRLYADPKRPRGDELTDGKWLVLKRDPSVPVVVGGLMRQCVWPAFGKRYGWRDWMGYAEKYGKPFPYTRYDADAVDEDKDLAIEVVQNIGNDVGAAFPKSIELEFKEARSGDNSKVHGGLIEHANAEMSKRVNGSTLATDSSDGGGASYAMAAVHDTVRWEAVQYDAGRLETEVSLQVLARFCHYNGITAPAPYLKCQIVRLSLIHI